MKQTNLQVTFLLLASLAVASCSNENEPLSGPDNTNNDPVELRITAGVSLTKSAINGGEQAGADINTTMKHVAVYALGGNSSSTDYSDGNNYAIYTRGDNASTWSNEGESAPKILLTGEKATIYAFHPAYKPGEKSAMKAVEPLKVTETFSADSKIPITVFPGADASGDSATITVNPNNADQTYSGSSWGVNPKADSILSAPGEVDYMWATPVQDRSNGKDATKASTSNPYDVDLVMNHAMSMVSFRIYNDGTYKGAGQLSKIVLSNTDQSGTALNQGNSPTMKVANGEVSSGASPTAVTYTRKIKEGNNDYFVLKKNGDSYITTDSIAKKASPKFSILVMPDAAASAKNAIQAVFAIDGVDYAVPLAADAESTAKWDKGQNNLYTVKLSGTGLEITSVNVQAWTTNDVTSGGDLEAK